MDPYVRKSLHLAASGRPLIILDTETTGLLRNSGPKAIAFQIGYVLRKSLSDPAPQEGARDLNIGVFLAPDTCRICKVDSDRPMRVGKDPIEVLEAFRTRLDGAIPIGHNYDGFDRQILINTYEQYRRPVPPELLHHGIGYSIDTLTLARALLPKGAPGSPEKHSNEALATHFKIPFDPATLHGALADSKLTSGIFTELIKLAEQLFSDVLYEREAARRSAAGLLGPTAAPAPLEEAPAPVGSDTSGPVPEAEAPLLLDPGPERPQEEMAAASAPLDPMPPEPIAEDIEPSFA